MAFKVVIPARYASQRLPGKPLSDVAGRPLLLRTIDRVKQSSVDTLVVATDDVRIESLCEKHSVDCVMTQKSHQSGTDRIAEVATVLQWDDDDVVINVQGDEPFIPADNIEQVALLTAEFSDGIATLATPLNDVNEMRDPNVVKVVLDKAGRALYFSRATIPWDRDKRQDPACQALRHIGIYGYKVSALKRFSATPVCALERCEQLEQLRALWHGWHIQVGVAQCVPGPGVDTPEDLLNAVAYFKRTQV